MVFKQCWQKTFMAFQGENIEKKRIFFPPPKFVNQLDFRYSLEMSSNGQWLAIGLDCQIWILKLNWTKEGGKISKIDHFATFEGHREPISGLHLMDCKDDAKLISISNDRSFNIWSIGNLECIYESPLLGHYSLTSSLLFSGKIFNMYYQWFFFEVIRFDKIPPP